MKKSRRDSLIATVLLILAVILINEYNRFLKRQQPACIDGQCPRPRGYGLVIDPFPDEMLPDAAEK